jgi:hypothetical protein
MQNYDDSDQRIRMLNRVPAKEDPPSRKTLQEDRRRLDYGLTA